MEPGESFERYTIEELLGEGGMGRVYRALDTRLHRKVALKILVLTENEEEMRSEGIARLLREARAAAALNHPNTVAIHDVGEHDGTPFIAMELIAGRTLRSFIGDESIAWRTRLRWLVDVARALAAAHKSGLVHRDVKPENVMVREDGVVKVLDFGVARRSSGVDVTAETHKDGVIPTLTGKGAVIGTPVYMSPEQMRGAPVDGRADQFGWGVLAFELLAGRRPWVDKPNQLALVASILTQPPESMRVSMPEVPAPVERAIHKTLAKDASERFASMDLLIAEIEPFAGSPSLPPPSLGARWEPPPDSGDTATTRRGVAAPSLPVPTELSPTRTPSRRKYIVPALALAIAALLGTLGLRNFAERRVPANPTVLVGRTPPVSADPKATRAFEEGMQAMRDGSPAEAKARLEEAVAIDPTLAAAWLRLSTNEFESDPARAREHFRLAYEHRAALSEHDAALLDATEPWVREPSDLAEWEKRLDAAALRYPKSVEIAYYHAFAHQTRSDFDGAAQLYQHAAQIDPHFALAWWSRGQVKYLLGKAQEAIASYDECLAKAPAALICIHEKARVFRREGDCARMEEEARRATAKEPSSALGYYYLAEALEARGRPVDSVREALSQYWARLPTDERREDELSQQASLAILAGDFVTAEKLARQKEEHVSGKTERSAHFAVASLLADIYLETGRSDAALKVAEDFVKREEAWNGAPSPLTLGEVRYRAGAINLAAFEGERAAWLEGQNTLIKTRGEGRSAHLRERGFSWIDGYAELAETREEAQAALALLYAYQPLPAETRRNIPRELAFGKVHALAGRSEDALSSLRRAAANCGALEYPIHHTRASYWLGTALEAEGKTQDACAAYGVVLERWGAKPSMTASKALERSVALKCGPR
jgi:serine/threonine-protein kinase